MSSKRVLAGGAADLQGSVVNGLLVGDYASRNPFKWRTTCQRCNASSVHSHALLLNGGARCLNSACGKDHLVEYANDSPSKARARYAAAESERQARIDAEQAEQRKQMEEELTANTRKLVAEQRKAAEHGLDTDFFVTPELAVARMTWEEAIAFNGEQSRLFVESCPEYSRYRNDKTFAVIVKYFEAHHQDMFNAEMIRRAFIRLRDLGMLTENPAPIPEPTQEPVEFVSEPVEAVTPVKTTQTGRDPLTGVEREYTTREIDRMSGDEYRRVFRIYKAALALPNRAAF